MGRAKSGSWRVVGDGLFRDVAGEAGLRRLGGGGEWSA